MLGYQQEKKNMCEVTLQILSSLCPTCTSHYEVNKYRQKQPHGSDQVNIREN